MPTTTFADWRMRAACLSADPELFFPLSDQGPARDRTARAKRICFACPVRLPCLDFALESGQAHGVWGGTSEDERARMRRSAARARRSGNGVAAGRSSPARW